MPIVPDRIQTVPAIWKIWQNQLKLWIRSIIFLHSWIQTLVFIIVFVSLRQYTGGYHAKSRVGCKMVTGLNLTLNILLVKIISQLSGIKNTFFCIMIILYVTICVKFILARVTSWPYCYQPKTPNVLKEKQGKRN